MAKASKVGSASSRQVTPHDFDGIARRAASWISSARSMRRAAYAVWLQWQHDCPELFRQAIYGPYLVLANLAIENLLKGLIVHADRSLVRNGKLRGDVLKQHDLGVLAQRAGITFTAPEDAFARLATSAMVGWGRYPVALSCAAEPFQVNVDAESGYVFDGLFRRLAAELSDRYYGHDTSSTQFQLRLIDQDVIWGDGLAPGTRPTRPSPSPVSQPPGASGDK